MPGWAVSLPCSKEVASVVSYIQCCSCLIDYIVSVFHSEFSSSFSVLSLTALDYILLSHLHFVGICRWDSLDWRWSKGISVNTVHVLGLTIGNASFYLVLWIVDNALVVFCITAVYKSLFTDLITGMYEWDLCSCLCLTAMSLTISK